MRLPSGTPESGEIGICYVATGPLERGRWPMLGDDPDDERVFTIRIWRERTAEGGNGRAWRGRLYDSRSRAFRHFVGLQMLFDLIRATLSGGRLPAPPPNAND